MPVAKAIKSQGTLLYYSLGSPTSFTAVGKIVGLDGPGGSSTKIDQTDLDDTQFKRMLPGLVDAGDVSFDLNFNPSDAGAAALIAAQKAGTLLEIKITPPSGSLSLYFDAYVTNFRTAAPADSKYTAKVALTLDGGYNWA
jgi:hypothetical protein